MYNKGKSDCGNDIFNCQTFRSETLCKICLGKDCMKGKCEIRKMFKGLCYICMLPSSAGGIKIHTDSFGSKCDLKCGISVYTLCMCLYQNEFWKSELEHVFHEKFTRVGDYFNWIQKKRVSGLPNGAYVFEWAIGQECGLFQ